MNNAFYAAAAALAIVSMAPAASATDISLTLEQVGTKYTSDYGNSGLSGIFSDTFTFSPVIGASIADFSLVQAGAGAASITFTTVTLDGIDLLPSLVAVPGGSFIILSDLLFAAGDHVLVIGGTAGGNASYGGTVNFAVTAVPEPATWAMMIAGIAAVGVTLRRRSQSVRVAFS